MNIWYLTFIIYEFRNITDYWAVDALFGIGDIVSF